MNFRLVLQRAKAMSSRTIAAACSLLFLVVCAAFWFELSSRKLSAVFSIVAILVMAGSYLLLRRMTESKASSSHLFLYALISLGLLFSAVFPPLSAPDEDFHFSASYVLSNFMMGKGYQNDDPVPMRESDAQLYYESAANVNLTASDYDLAISDLSQPLDSSSSEVQVITGRSHWISGNLPQSKIASALGITLARLLNLGPYYLYQLGRLCNLALYIALVYVAFKIAPIGRNVIATVSLLPMSLHLAASYSYDAFIIPMAILLTALCLRSIFRTDGIANSECVQIVLVAALLAPCKVIYTMVALLALFIPRKRFDSRKHELAVKLGCIAIVAMVLLGGRALDSYMHSVNSVQAPSDGLDYRGEQSGHFYTVGDILSSPLRFAYLFFHTFDCYGYQYLQRMVGGSLAWFQTEIASPDLFVFAFGVLLLLACVSSDDDEGRLSAGARMLGVLVFGAGVLLVMLSMLLSFTFNTETIISGVQGRYFLPYLPWFMLSLRGDKIRVAGSLQPFLIESVLLLNLYNLIRIFAIALTL